MEIKQIALPLRKEDIRGLEIGDKALLTGDMLVARDAAHARIYDAIINGKALPFDISGQVIYYMGPSPAREGRVIGSAGPTTSARMDKFTPLLLRNGLVGMIGKGGRSEEVIDAIKQYGAVYFTAIGGCGALLSKSITKSEVVCYDDLGAEAVRKITVCNFPCYVYAK